MSISITKLLVISVLALLLLPTFAFAVNIPGWPLVPCGLSQDNPSTPINEKKICGRCDLFQLLKNIIDFVIGGLMPPLAVLFFVWAGFLILLSGANPGLYAQGQTIFKNTFYGIIILLSAWMITNTLILSVGARYNNAGNWWQFTCTEPAPVSPPVITPTSPPPGSTLSVINQSLPEGVINVSYSSQLSASGGTSPYTWSISSGTLPPGVTISSTGFVSGTPTTAGTSTFTVRVEDSSTPKQSATKQLTITVTSSTASTLSIITSSLSGGTVGQSYTQQLQVQGGSQPYRFSVSAGSLPAGLTLNLAGGNISGTPTTAGTSTFTVRVEDSSTPKQSATKQLDIVVGGSGTLACMFNNVDYATLNLCSGQRRPGGCGTSVCSQYLPSIQRHAGGAASVNVLKTFMVIESDCNIGAGTGTSYGLMQISPNTVTLAIASRCGVSQGDINRTWLTDPANADKSICLGAEIIRSIAAGTCGPEPRNIYAGYNAGPGNCASSRDCAGEQSCGGGTKKKWECPYDNPQHTVCNTGMYQTKQGATYINYCLNNLGF